MVRVESNPKFIPITMSLADLASQVQTLTDNQKELSRVVSGNQEWAAQKFLSQERSSVIG